MTRAERTTFGEWWWTIDRWLMFWFVGLMVSGFLFGLAAYPPVANKLGLPTFHFVNRQAFFLVVSGLIMVGASFLIPRQVRRAALLLFIVGLGLVVMTLFYGAEVKGARRWINLPGFSLQPSEILKPAFVVRAAWAFSERQSRRDMPSLMIAMALLPMVGSPQCFLSKRTIDVYIAPIAIDMLRICSTKRLTSAVYMAHFACLQRWGDTDGS